MHTNQTWLTRTHTHKQLCLCVHWLHLSCAAVSACASASVCVCVRVASTPRWLQIFETHAQSNAADDDVDVAAIWQQLLLLYRFVLRFFVFCCLFFLFSAVFCFLFGKMQKVYLSAVKTWLQTWNANANLVQSLHYADKPAKSLQLRINPAQQILEKDKEERERQRVFIKFLPQKQLHLRCVTRLRNAVENCQINHSYLYKRP